tara:strand:+ start:618 stop:1040 length:423 start_codon:yes stop_codon:yes gene_type:complete
MKIYEANNELEDVLTKHGFEDYSTEIDNHKGKRRFKKSKSAKKWIYFDYVNITVFNSTSHQDSRIKMTESELKALILYFELSPTDSKEIFLEGIFDFKKSLKKLESMKSEILRQSELNNQNSRTKKFSKILNTYNNISLN